MARRDTTFKATASACCWSVFDLRIVSLSPRAVSNSRSSTLSATSSERRSAAAKPIIRAAYDRGRITRERYSSLFKQLSARGWRTNEPMAVPREYPRLWPEILRIHRQQHAFSDQDLADIARVDLCTLSDLFPDDFSAPRLRLRTLRSASQP